MRSISRTIRRTMRIRSALLIPVAVVLSIGTAPVSAKYTEQWLSNSDIARVQAGGRAQKKKVLSSRRALTESKEEDPIAAFAHNSHARPKATRR